MTNFLDRLGLQPHEKRVVVVVAAIVFAVLNYLFIWPRMADYRTVVLKKEEAESKAAFFKSHVEDFPKLTNRVHQLEVSGAGSLKHDQGSQFLSTIQTEASKAVLNITQTRNLPSLGGATSTNDFVEDRVIMISFNASDSSLVDFLYAFSLPKSSLRVQSFDIGPEAPSHQRFSGSLTLVGSIDRPPAPKADLTKPAAKNAAVSKDAKTAPPAKGVPSKTPGSAGAQKSDGKQPVGSKPVNPTPQKPGATPPGKSSTPKTNSISHKK